MKLKKPNYMKSLKESIPGYLFVLPQLLFFLVFIIYPIFEGFRVSLYKINFTNEQFVGFENYTRLFSDPIFHRSVINTLVFVVSIVSMTIVFSLFVATSIYDKTSGYISFIRGTYYLPVMVSMVVMSMVWNFMLNPANGLINYFLKLLNISGLNLLGDVKTVIPVIVFVTFVSNMGQSIILYVAAIIGIPGEILEAAEVDGAGRITRIMRIMIPLLQPTTLYILVINTIGVLKIFVVIQLLTDGGPMNSSVTMMYYLYQNAFVYGRTGMAAAVGVLMFLLAVLIAIPQFKMLSND